ncbi:helicase-related protein [Bacillus sp. EB01]|uniref:helicase-related protein n=1 Tax=Bacillus sp. EB01 TaxID=1347086 RepID=UPI0005C573CB|nr:helicase-related protein [Bacillus sp. EB01]
MQEIVDAYKLAVEQTKKKIKEDISKYLETKEALPPFNQYAEDRMHYLEQLWVNVWLNKATNSVSKKAKKEFLAEKGFDTEGVDRKLINRLFRTEIRDFSPFDVNGWVDSEIGKAPEKWRKMYDRARKNYKERLEAEKVQQQREKNTRSIVEHAEAVFHDHEMLLYLLTRHMVAQELKKDMEQGKKYKRIDSFRLEEKLTEIGPFSVDDYLHVYEFFDEFTGDIHKTNDRGRYYFEYETYYYPYERLIGSFVLRESAKLISESLPGELAGFFVGGDERPQNGNYASFLIAEMAEDLSRDFIERIADEYMDDLINLTDIPFDPEKHLAIYEQNLKEAEKRQAEEEAEAERQAAEEQRMLDEVFGVEYRISSVRNVNYVLHIGETNTGKTHHALTSMMAASSGLYLAPLRLLALEVYDRLNSQGVPCSLKTGEEEKLEPNANHFACTVEMFHEKDFYEVVVIDEAQMVADRDRGFSWYKAITKANAREVHIIGSRNIKEMVLHLLGNADYEMIEYTRDIPLQVEDKEFSLRNTRKGDALVCFSRKQVLSTAAALQGNGHKVSMIYGSMPPETRKKQMQRFIDGETAVIVATDAIGMGLNLPIRRIVFLENEKFDGTSRRRLTSQEIKQIAGRAGRKGIYNIGKVAFVSDIQRMKRLLEAEDKPVNVFAIAPTNAVFERFQRYSRNLGDFFELWEKYQSPPGTKKAELAEERSRYELIEGTFLESKFPMMELYGFLHLPFSAKEPQLTEQWLQTMEAIATGRELPEPSIKRRNLEDMELTYKAIGLHLLFLYKLGMRTEAIYWERMREQVSDGVHEELNDVGKSIQKKCKICGKPLPADFPYGICNECHSHQKNRKYGGRKFGKMRRSTKRKP